MKYPEFLDKMCEQIQELSDKFDAGKVIHTRELAEVLLNLFQSHALHSEVLERLDRKLTRELKKSKEN